MPKTYRVNVTYRKRVVNDTFPRRDKTFPIFLTFPTLGGRKEAATPSANPSPSRATQRSPRPCAQHRTASLVHHERGKKRKGPMSEDGATTARGRGYRNEQHNEQHRSLSD